MTTAIELTELTKTYVSRQGSRRVARRGLSGLDLTVQAGEVFGYLGPNGAGKSTTIRLLLDLIRPTSGTIRVLGRDPRADAVDLHRRVGYLAGDFVVDGRQKAGECLAFLGNLRGGVPTARIVELADRLELDLGARIKSLSKGNRQKVGLVQAFMHDPELLILDEPTSGLDPLVQQTFLDMVAEAKSAGRTVFMSSHIMSEVEAVADRVAIIRDGRLVALDTVAGLRARSLLQVRIDFTAPVPAEEFTGLPGVTDLEVQGTTLTCNVNGSPDALVKAAARHTVTGLHADTQDLEELFHAYYTGQNPGRQVA
ncbi:ABC transporter ATP-binding protein [Thermomonospora cellulosilytica]|uniref:ABC-2 type transport system ATP-binding protein n=1 Tax=Thermomonospora cellulosilytica TaxID=1411118 RepID=A0A7W3R9Z1_9ACTN|nr:ABC transporter ATP-binding protein [Thermomonospora cellulosilytica]MBA9005189.1 ABC-2 type transport system ATP-binding protein [Thermomonospora cellulosilytica]